MAVYLGDAGILRITRSAGDELRGRLDPADVEVAEKRFSFDFPSGALITGDRVNIRRLKEDGDLSTDPLGLTASGESDGSWYINVDPLDGLRLYDNWSDSLVGSKPKAIALTSPPANMPVIVTIDSTKSACIGQMLDYSISTNRENVDITALGEDFRSYDSGLISGQGSLRAVWDWRHSDCGDLSGDQETAQYLHQLILRQRLGSEFHANFFIKRRSTSPVNESISVRAQEIALYYDANCLITGVSMDFASGEMLVSSVDFVMTGPIQMRYERPSAYLILQEDGDKIWLEDSDGYLAREFEL